MSEDVPPKYLDASYGIERKFLTQGAIFVVTKRQHLPMSQLFIM